MEEQVFSQLEEEILCGLYKKGTSLTEMSLSYRLGVSRTPVRSALHRLAEEGLVEIIPNKGAVVVGVTVDDLIDTYRIRMRLEGLASAIATGRLTDDEKKKLKESVELFDYYMKKQDSEHLKELDTEFHGIIYRASRNRVLCKILTDLHRSIKTYRKMSFATPGRTEISVQEHREILEAILRGDGEEADRLTSLHVKRAMENLLTKFKSE